MTSNHQPQGAITVVAERLGFTEGPLWTSGGRLLVASVSRGLIYDVALAGGTTEAVAESGGGLSGLAEDETGTVWIAQGGPRFPSRSHRAVTPSIQRLCAGEVHDIVEGLDAPNDCVVGPDGLLWFTDPRGSAIDTTPEPGRVCAMDRRTATVAVMASGGWFPNGLAFSPDLDQLYVAETAAARLVRYSHQPAGLGKPEIFIELPRGRPDGLAVDREGNLYVAATTADAVLVFDPAGKMIEIMELGPGTFPTNVCFGGPDMATLYITAPRGGRVLAMERAIPGLPLSTQYDPHDSPCSTAKPL